MPSMNISYIHTVGLLLTTLALLVFRFHRIVYSICVESISELMNVISSIVAMNLQVLISGVRDIS